MMTIKEMRKRRIRGVAAAEGKRRKTTEGIITNEMMTTKTGEVTTVRETRRKKSGAMMATTAKRKEVRTRRGELGATRKTMETNRTKGNMSGGTGTATTGPPGARPSERPGIPSCIKRTVNTHRDSSPQAR
jgi:hypothetical protein